MEVTPHLFTKWPCAIQMIATTSTKISMAYFVTVTELINTSTMLAMLTTTSYSTRSN